MKAITKKDLIKGVPDRFKQQYPSPTSFNKEIVDELLEKQPTTEDEITKIIGNSSWTSNVCDECDSDSDVTIMLGQEPDYDSSTASVCVPCLKKAIKLGE